MYLYVSSCARLTVRAKEVARDITLAVNFFASLECLLLSNLKASSTTAIRVPKLFIDTIDEKRREYIMRGIVTRSLES